jgi:LysM repeat protein
VTPEQRHRLARVGAPAAFLLAFTIFVLIVRSGMQEDEAAVPVTTTAPTQATTRAAPPTTTQAPATTAAATTTTGEELYEIQSGDTLETVAAEFGTTVDALIELNPGIDPRTLSIGQQIRVR